MYILPPDVEGQEVAVRNRFACPTLGRLRSPAIRCKCPSGN